MSERRPKIHFIPQSMPSERPAAPHGAVSTPILMREALHGVLRHVHAEEQMRAEDGEVFLPQSVYQKIMEHLSSDTRRELGGLLVGTEILCPEGRPAILIRDALPARHTRSTGTRLTFPEESWVEFNRELDRRRDEGIELQRVGWYHSHPGMRIFLSHWDLDVCLEFRRATQVALVVDPIEPKGGFFVQGTEGFRAVMPQGFWEIKDLKPASVVEWKSLSSSSEVPPAFLTWLTSKPAAPEALPAEEAPAALPDPPPQPVAVEPAPQPPSPSPSAVADIPVSPSGAGKGPSRRYGIAALAVAALLAAFLAFLGRSMWSDEKERSEAAFRKQGEDISRLSREVDALKASTAELDRRISGAVVPQSVSPKEPQTVAAVPEQAATPPKLPLTVARDPHQAPQKTSPSHRVAQSRPPQQPAAAPLPKAAEPPSSKPPVERGKTPSGSSEQLPGGAPPAATPPSPAPKAAEPSPSKAPAEEDKKLSGSPEQPPGGAPPAATPPPPAPKPPAAGEEKKPPEDRGEMLCWP